MAQESTILTKSLYVNPERRILVMNLNEQYFTGVNELVDSNEFKELVTFYLNTDNLFNTYDDYRNLTADQFIEMTKRILAHDERVFANLDRQILLSCYEDAYTYFRNFLRVTVTDGMNKVLINSFLDIDDRLNDLFRTCYRTLTDEIRGRRVNRYRQISSASNAALLTKHHDWPMPAGYESLGEINFIDTAMIRPPLMMHTPSNKREGVFSPVSENPVKKFARQQGEWYCYPAKIGTSIAYIYFHEDFMVSGLSLTNLFAMAHDYEVEGRKPDLILFFGLDKTEGDVSHYYYDEANDIWVGEVPNTVKTTYFGYMKKMCLTLHNLHQIKQGKLPIHGSMVRIAFSNGKTKNVVFFGDSGAGKSESLEALQEIADEQIVDMETIFDDMGSFTIDGDKVYAQGTETGAFVRLDDLSSAVAFNNMDRGIYLNPELKNARVIIPVTSIENVIAHHHVDMWVYANNYDAGVGIHQFENEEAAKEVFVAGKRKALGTTDESGMTTTFFANPFGPVQEPELTKPVIDEVFKKFFEQGIYVGEIYTHLGYDRSAEALHDSARAMLKVLMDL